MKTEEEIRAKIKMLERFIGENPSWCKPRYEMGQLKALEWVLED